MDREQRLTETFVSLADTLVADFDVVDLLDRLVHSCVDLLGATAAGLLLADQRGNLQMVAATSEATSLLEQFQLIDDDGPCVDCFRSGEPVVAADLSLEQARWPRFVPAALDSGHHAVHAHPMQLRDQTIGALNIFHGQVHHGSEADQMLARGLADTATITILSQRALHREEILAEQLQSALTSRVIVEQAKGMLAESGSIGMEGAFGRLRRYARGHNLRLAELARDLVEGRVTPAEILAPVSAAQETASRRK